ncbi:exodeoxyribonuclease V subunit beta [Roseateles koreensis]|uniref:RecBCD enzyme subunit RecB n=1 Tax=Roseateles koreensis TaxID=2987526 RepID=A0ABT5KRM5_9BURK|nr:exodeoxyribonuclease V subunit beta [Roseateles koreensis]MDC8785539.1 exodeoxyribonuclease V subunit beta [Roseateles koreensis]
MSERLDPLKFPLWGSRLIEASAGTGKTWTIAALYVRLVLGHGELPQDTGDGAHTAFIRPMLPSEILVMTFTRAATRELSDRIRARLLEAARSFRAETPDEDEADDYLRELLTAYPRGPVRERAAWNLSLAAESMDDAAVHTIDAWCQRVLREHAFDSGCLFDETLQADEAELQELAAQDYWRAELYPLHGESLERAMAVWPHVQVLTDSARQLLGFDMPANAGDGSLADVIEASHANLAATLGELKQGWAERAAEIQRWLDGLYASKTCPFNKTKLAQRHYTNWLQALADWAGDVGAVQPELSPAARHRLTLAGMAEAWKPGLVCELPEVFDAFGQLMMALTQLPQPEVRLRVHATARIQQRLAELKQKAGSFGFADMLVRLDRALDPALNGANAQRLRERLLAQYPVALIDEFQDTAPLQLRIFDRIYRIAEPVPDRALFLIGDPKQSIYGFRGADIYSYLSARRATQGRHYVLGTNHRSTQDLVRSVNRLFSSAEQRPGEGAFKFRAAEAGGADEAGNPLPFEPVEARGRPERLVSGARQPVAALDFAVDAEMRDTQNSQRLFASHCAERIVTLLNDPGAGFFDKAQQRFTRLRPADVAVLVRTGREAAAVQRELRRRAIASVYLSDKDSVFTSDEAQDLLRWLKAVAAPLDSRLVRAALATRLLALPLETLAHLAADDEAFEARSEQLKALRQIWLRQGVLAMLRQTLHRLDLPARWLNSGPAHQVDAAEAPPRVAPSAPPATNGERRLTNFLHLAELLQAASRQMEGEQALIRWLSTEIEAASGRGGDDHVLRLESDADLVKVVTVHKSKGLEYPLVFLPFACSYRAEQARKGFVKLADGDGTTQLHLQPGDELIEAADQERLREDLRLLYVALTRARHALWVGVAALKVGNSRDCMAYRSALGYLLGLLEKTDGARLQTEVEQLLAGQEAMCLTVVSGQMPAATPLQSRAVPPPLRELPPYAAAFERQWTIGSFSAMVRGLGSGNSHAAAATTVVTTATATATAVSVASARSDETLDGAPMAPDVPAFGGVSLSASLEPWHTFPRGALAGNFLHDQLEWLMNEKAPGEGLLQSPELQEQLRRRCERQGWGHRAPEALAWLAQVCAAELPPLGQSLDAIHRPLPEMEFWFPSEGLLVDELDALCREHLLSGRDRPAVSQRELRGMLMGFADLVFEVDGRYFVLDYKSNALGTADADYDNAALEAAMASHRYDLQAALYLLALHRLLQARLGAAYQPAQHLGGAVFLFLRGIKGPQRGCHHIRPSLSLLNRMDELFRQDRLSEAQTA